MNYIGIRGHRGAGKQTVAYLLGNTLDYLLDKKKMANEIDSGEFNNFFIQKCNDIINNENIIDDTDLKKVYFDSFGDSPKTFCSLLLGCDPKLTYNDYYKDHIIINIKDFSYKLYDYIPNNIKCLSAEELYKMFNNNTEPSVILKDTYTTLREFIMYFGREVMQRYFGLNVWIKTLKMNEERYSETYNDSNYYKIYMDIKFPSEVTYIKDKKGIIIKVSRPKYKKNGADRLAHDDRYDYDVVIGNNLYDLKQTILNIANEIIYSYDKEEN